MMMHKTNVMGTLNMLGLAKRVGARFLLTSTSEVYGDPLEHPQKESYWGHVNPIGLLILSQGDNISHVLEPKKYLQPLPILVCPLHCIVIYHFVVLCRC